MRKRERAEIIMLKLDNQYKEKGKFPASLNELNLDFDTDYLNYSVDSLHSFYSLSYTLDGWHFKSYDSKEREWIGGD